MADDENDGPMHGTIPLLCSIAVPELTLNKENMLQSSIFPSFTPNLQPHLSSQFSHTLQSGSHPGTRTAMKAADLHQLLPMA